MPQCSLGLQQADVCYCRPFTLRRTPRHKYQLLRRLLHGKPKLAGRSSPFGLATVAFRPASACSMQLATTCILLFIGASGAGLLPLILKTSPAQLRMLSAAGAGLLVGTGLGVILPEGFEAFHKAQYTAGDDALPEALQGTTLLLGFLAMLMLDIAHQFVSGEAGHPHGRGSPTDYQAANGDPERQQNGHFEAQAAGANPNNPMALIGRSDEATRALIGLIIHSAADGLAVGASSLSTDKQLTGLIALAMVLHKMPTAIGLTSYLRGRSWPLHDALKALLIFASASPLVALACAAILVSVPSLGSSPEAIALCLIFSGGTFLYAACLHVLPESLSGKGRNAAAQAGCVVVASCLPLTFSIFHHH